MMNGSGICLINFILDSGTDGERSGSDYVRPLINQPLVTRPVVTSRMHVCVYGMVCMYLCMTAHSFTSFDDAVEGRHEYEQPSEELQAHRQPAVASHRHDVHLW